MDKSCYAIHLNKVLYVLFIIKPALGNLELFMTLYPPATSTLFTATANETAATFHEECRQKVGTVIELELFTLLKLGSKD